MYKKVRKLYKNIIPPQWRTKIQIITVVLVFAIIVVFQFYGTRSAPLIVNFYDIGQGDAIHIRTQDGFDILIDGGPDSSIVSKLGSSMSFWDKTIELMILTHPHADHLVGQLDVLDRYEVKKVISTGVVHTTDEYLTWLDKINQKGIEIQIARAGQIYNVGEGVLEIIWPEQDYSGKRILGGDNEKGGGLNDTSIVSRLTFNNFSFLFTGDIGDEVEKKLIDLDIQSDVLKVGHHGSKYSSSKEFIEKISPKYAIIQSGENNTFGHPHFASLWNLKNQAVEILRNDQIGDIGFVIDENGMRLR